jgi:hypothetical protein
MTVRVPRLPFSLDPLMAEAKRRARQRHMLIALAVLLAGLAVGLTFAFRSPDIASPNARVSTKVLRPTNPRQPGNHAIPNLYLQVRGSAGVLARVEHGFAGAPFVPARTAQGHEVCTINYTVATGRYAGQEVTFQVYGNNPLAGQACVAVRQNLPRL